MRDASARSPINEEAPQPAAGGEPAAISPSEKRGGPKHPLNLTLQGMSELEQFPTERHREEALREIAKEATNVKSGSYWLAVVILVSSALLTRYIAKWGLGMVVWPRWIEEAVLWGSVLGVFWFVLRRLHRWGAPEELRSKLLRAGVPICRRCGYSLRGLPLASQRCPECGAEFDERVREILAGEQTTQ